MRRFWHFWFGHPRQQVAGAISGAVYIETCKCHPVVLTTPPPAATGSDDPNAANATAGAIWGLIQTPYSSSAYPSPKPEKE